MTPHDPYKYKNKSDIVIGWACGMAYRATIWAAAASVTFWVIANVASLISREPDPVPFMHMLPYGVATMCGLIVIECVIGALDYAASRTGKP